MGWTSRRTRAVFLTALMMLVLTPTSGAQSEANSVLDERMSIIDLSPNQDTTVQVETGANTSVLLSWSCGACTVFVDDTPTHITTTDHGASMLSVHVEEAEILDISLSSTLAESMTLMMLRNINNDELHALRPSPETAVVSAQLRTCLKPTDCIDLTTEGLTSQSSDTVGEIALHTGEVHVSEDQHLVFNASQGDTLEWQWLATTHAVQLQIYHQTSTEEVLLNAPHASNSMFSQIGQTTATAAYWTAPDDGRFVARISTDDAHAIWGALAFMHPHRPVDSLVGLNLTEGVQVLGHANTTSPFDWSEVEALKLEANGGDVEISVDQLLDGAWVEGAPSTLQDGDSITVFPYPDVSVGRLHVVNTSVFSLNVNLEGFSDADGLEAPSYLPQNLETENASWPVMNLSGAASGELTLAVHDTTDTYRIVVDGWEDSIHFVQFVVDGEIDGLELQLWDIDQTTSETLATDITRPIGDQLKIGLQVGRGTHYLQIRFQNASEATPHLWGEDVEPRSYVLQPSYSLIDEGEEPWFPPSDEAVYWGNIARWFMGILFLLPVLYLGVHVQRSRSYAASVAEKKQRLAWYTSRLDSGESNVKQARTDMAKALHAVAQLAWQDGLEAWGPKRLEHRTEDVALAVWSVDERLANREGAWPIVVGVHVINGTWDLAALRFDAPEGEPYEVVHVEPRFLFQGEEVFLDTMGPGHRTYLVVELSGTAAQVDLELNGRMDGEPFAARISESLVRSEATS